ncbi:hypothetical protein SLEP1_g59472, partial [Rubroshorea leprosula]
KLFSLVFSLCKNFTSFPSTSPLRIEFHPPSQKIKNKFIHPYSILCPYSNSEKRFCFPRIRCQEL